MGINLWDRKKSLNYIKVGSFFLVGISLFFILLLSIRELTFFKGTYLIVVKFEFAEGLRPSSPVRFCGVDVGEVKNVRVKEEEGIPMVYVYAKIQNGIKIPKDAYFFINSLSLFGEKYLEITPPLNKQEGYIKEGEVLEGISPIPLFTMFADFTKTMKEVRDFIEEGKVKTSLENTLANIESISASIRAMVEDMHAKKGTIGRLLYDETLYEAAEEFVLDLKKNPWKLLHKPK